AVRVVSPYFDKGSAALLGNLLEELGTGTAGNRIEVWTDGSGCVARRSDYQSLLKLIAAHGRAVELKKVLRRGRHGEFGGPAHLHAKLIEVEDSKGTVRRLLGSANFTGAAWVGSFNTESVYLEADRRALPTLLGPRFESGPL